MGPQGKSRAQAGSHLKLFQTSRKPVLIVQHAEHEHPAIVRRSLESQGVPTWVIHPYLGEAYPKLSEIRGIVSLGGPMGANDHHIHPWITSECALMKGCIENELPLVGICLGAQMLAKALGAEVSRNSVAEVGWFPVEINNHGAVDRVLGSAGPNPLVYHWHNDTFFLPAGAVLLAKSQACPRQAYRIDNIAYGFQFHPEADHQLIHEWLQVEGIDEEIEETQRAHGATTVQNSETMKSRAAQGEKASLKITASATQLFQDTEYEPIKCTFYDQLELWIMLRTILLLEMIGSDGSTVLLKGNVVMLFTVPDGEFIIFREENTLLWPVRMDYIRAIRAF